MARSKNKRSYKKKHDQTTALICCAPDHVESTINLNLDYIVRELETAKANSNGKIPYGGISNICKKMKPTLPWLTRDMIKYRLKKLNMNETETVLPSYGGDEDSVDDSKETTRIPSPSFSSISTLTCDSAFADETMTSEENNSSTCTTRNDNDNHHSDKGLELNSLQTPSQSPVLADSDDNPKTGSSTALTHTNSSSFGRPKGAAPAFQSRYQRTSAACQGVCSTAI